MTDARIRTGAQLTVDAAQTHRRGLLRAALGGSALAATGLGAPGVLAKVVGAGFGGAFHELELKCAGQQLRLRITTDPPPLGATVEVRLDPDHASVFPADGDNALRDRSWTSPGN